MASFENKIPRDPTFIYNCCGYKHMYCPLIFVSNYLIYVSDYLICLANCPPNLAALLKSSNASSSCPVTQRSKGYINRSNNLTQGSKGFINRSNNLTQKSRVTIERLYGAKMEEIYVARCNISYSWISTFILNLMK
jgi:hypothetical protein